VLEVENPVADVAIVHVLYIGVTSFDVGVVGLGAMGSMTTLELARRGRRVIGFDRFTPPHPFGSSHGKSRIIREAYFEHPQYVPLVQRAYERWAELERDAGEQLLIPTGGLMIGPPDGVLVSGAKRSALEHGLPFELLSPEQVAQRFPVFGLGSGDVGLFEPRAGVLLPEPAVAAALRLAQAAGAELHFDEPVSSWTAGERVTLRTRAGHRSVGHVVLSAGAWLSSELTRLDLPLQVARQTLFWFASDSSLTAPDRMPIFIWEWQPGRMFYGFPDLGDGVKLAIHHEGEATSPDQVRRTVYPDESQELTEVAAARLAGLSAPPRESAVCLYTNTPDGDFVLDRHPADDRVIVASPCSGHGFKFAPAIGEAIADLVDQLAPRVDLTPFRLSRFAPGR
jgi:sarcosine oxidase